MPNQNHTVSASDVLLVILLTTFVLFVMITFQCIQIMRDRDTLQQVYTQQDKPLEESRKVQQQFTALALGTKKLADGGDKGAALIVARMEQMGFKFGDAAAAGQPSPAPGSPSAPPAPAAPPSGP